MSGKTLHIWLPISSPDPALHMPSRKLFGKVAQSSTARTSLAEHCMLCNTEHAVQHSAGMQSGCEVATAAVGHASFLLVTLVRGR
jgi:hypothetical protein